MSMETFNQQKANTFIQSYINNSITVKSKLLEQANNISDIVNSLVDVIRNGGRIYTFGNGGSACDAMHLAEELVARYLRERPGIKAQHLIDSGTITCWANDYSYQTVFERQVETLVTKNDAVIAFSTSGKTENVIRGVKSANHIGALTIGLSGKGGGELANEAKLNLIVQSNITSHIQEAHITIVHIICDLLETNLFPDCK